VVIAEATYGTVANEAKTAEAAMAEKKDLICTLFPRSKHLTPGAGTRLPVADEGGYEATLFADGGSRGNPGPAASGSVLIDPAGVQIKTVGTFLNVATNNVAEWTALVQGLEAASRLGIRRLAVRLDSELVVKQMSGEYRVKHPDLQPLHRRASQLCRAFERVEIRHVPRKQNALADALVNQVLDAEAARAQEARRASE
jgi:ribonuclease HI